MILISLYFLFYIETNQHGATGEVVARSPSEAASATFEDVQIQRNIPGNLLTFLLFH